MTIFDGIAIVTATFLLYKGWRESQQIGKSPIPETLKIYEELLTKQSERMAEMSKCMDDLEKTDKVRDKQIAELERKFAVVEEWAERLVHQVQSMGGIPVKMKSHIKV